MKVNIRETFLLEKKYSKSIENKSNNVGPRKNFEHFKLQKIISGDNKSNRQIKVSVKNQPNFSRLLTAPQSGGAAKVLSLHSEIFLFLPYFDYCAFDHTYFSRNNNFHIYRNNIFFKIGETSKEIGQIELLSLSSGTNIVEISGDMGPIENIKLWIDAHSKVVQTLHWRFCHRNLDKPCI